MRGKFIFVVLGLCFFVGCQNKGIIEIKNSTHRDITFKITHKYGEEFFKDTIEVKKGETARKGVVLKGANNEWDAFVGYMSMAIYEDGKERVLDIFGVGKNDTTKLEIIGYLKECPDPRLIGEWVSEDDSEDSIIFENSNKCKIDHKLYNIYIQYDYDFAEWALSEDGNLIRFRPWLDIGSSVNQSVDDSKWGGGDSFQYIDLNTIMISTIKYKKNNLGSM